jgi:radical SAM protein with 4Fe4S-binding SPASM domain
MMRGIALLKEAGARYVIQAFPMRDNWHQWPQMVELAKSLGPEWRIGAAWLNLSAEGDPERNAMIASQRLAPAIVVELDKPSMLEDDEGTACAIGSSGDDRLLAQCIPDKRKVHIDPYGKLSICCSVKNPAWRFDLRKGTMQEAWEQFIPSLMDKVRGEEKYKQQCGACELRNDCRWCPMYAYLEHGNYRANVPYLCDIARETRKFKEEWHADHRRFFTVAGIHFQIDSDLPFLETTLQPALSTFRTESPGTDIVRIRHHFSLAGIEEDSLGEEVCRHSAWTIFRKGNSWIYRCAADNKITVAIGVFNHDHSRGTLYHASDEGWRRGGVNSLSLPITDQILLARLLAERSGCIIHSAGVILDGQGWLFVGHSEAGKTTVTRLMEKEGEILCDDRNVVRVFPDGYKLFGTWSHGDSSLVSRRSAPLRAALFLKQSRENRLVRLGDRKEIFRRILACSIRGFVDAGWLNHTLDFIEAFSRDIPCFELHFNRKIDLAAMLRELNA